MITHKDYIYYVDTETGNIGWYDGVIDDDDSDYIFTPSLVVADSYSLNIVRNNYIRFGEDDMFNGEQATKRSVLGNQDIVYIDRVRDTILQLWHDYPEEFI